MRRAGTDELPLYLRVAESVRDQVHRGSLRVGDRAPSLRRLQRQHRVSMSTTLLAYRWLEDHGYLEARARSGFFVRLPRPDAIPEPQPDARRPVPRSRSTSAILAQVMRAIGDPAPVPFGAGSIDPELLPNAPLNRSLRRIVTRQPTHSASYAMPPGLEVLRRQIARRSADMGCRLAPEDIQITSGTLEGIQLAMRAVASPGQTIAVESPTYFGALEVAATIGLRVVEIPTHPRHGMDLEALAHAIRRHRVRACFVMTNCHNPLGYVLADTHKRALVELTARHGVAVIEDDLYGDMAFAAARPRTTKAFDRDGLVILCSSFSKMLAPGFRVGWVAGGRFAGAIERLKMFASLSTPSLPQMVVADFLESGGYDRHLRRLRANLANQVESVRQGVARYFPEGTRVSRPAGGHMLWVELPAGTDAIQLFHAALDHGISVVPGAMFSPTQRFANFLRLNCGRVWSERYEQALVTLGRLCAPAGARVSAPPRGARERAGA